MNCYRCAKRQVAKRIANIRFDSADPFCKAVKEKDIKAIKEKEIKEGMKKLAGKQQIKGLILRLQDGKDRRLWVAVGSLLINLMVLAVMFLIFRAGFETNDDIGIANMVNGVRGKFDPHLVYSNYIIGCILAFCYRIRQWVPWYSLYQYALMVCAFSALMYVIVRRSGNRSFIWVALTLISFFSYECYVKMQFTKTAGVVSAAGFYLLFYALEEAKIRWPELIVGYILAGFGFMVRSDQFFAELGLLFAVCLILFFQALHKEKIQRKRLLIRDILCGWILLFLIGGLHLADKMAYQTPEWQEYQVYNDARSELLDYGFPDYTKNKEAYEELGIDLSAYRMLVGWNHMDPELFPLETLEKLIELKEPKKLDLSFVKQFFQKFPFKFTVISSFWTFVVLFVFSLCWGKHGKEEWLAILYELFMIMLLYFYLFYCDRYLLNRVDVGIWLAASLVVLWSVSKADQRFSHRMGIVLFAAVLCMQQNTARKNWRINSEDRGQALLEERAVLQSIHTDLDHLYLFKASTISFANAYSVFSSIPFEMGRNLYPLGGWASATPLYQETLKEYGVTNPFRDIIGNEKIYIIDNSISNTLEYIQKHYDKDAKAVLVSELGAYKIYQIESGNK